MKRSRSVDSLIGHQSLGDMCNSEQFTHALSLGCNFVGSCQRVVRLGLVVGILPKRSFIAQNGPLRNCVLFVKRRWYHLYGLGCDETIEIVECMSWGVHVCATVRVVCLLQTYLCCNQSGKFHVRNLKAAKSTAKCKRLEDRWSTFSLNYSSTEQFSKAKFS